MYIDEEHKRWMQFIDTIIASLNEEDKRAIIDLSDNQLILVTAFYGSKIGNIQNSIEGMSRMSPCPYDKNVLAELLANQNKVLARIVNKNTTQIEAILKNVKKIKRQKALNQLARKGNDSIKKTHLTLK